MCNRRERCYQIVVVFMGVLLAVSARRWWTQEESIERIEDVLHDRTLARLEGYLDQHPADINAPTVGSVDPPRTGVTPLMIACRNNDVAAMDALLRRGAAVSVADSREWDAFEHAAACGSNDAVTFLLGKGYSPRKPGGAVMAGAAALDSNVFSRLLKIYGEDRSVSGEDRQLLYDYAMYQSVSAADAGNLKLLMKVGATGQIAFPYRRGLLHVAAAAGNTEAVSLLLEKGEISINERDGGGDGPLHDAIWNGHTAVVRILLDHGADVTNAGGSLSSLGTAAMRGSAEIVSLLMTRGGKDLLEVPRDDGSTPLILAAWCGNSATVQVLLDAGANMDARTKNGWTAYDCANSRSDPEGRRIIELLNRRSKGDDRSTDRSK